VKISSINHAQLIDELERICRRIKKSNRSVKRIFLFGSFQKGNYTPGSDVDILITLGATPIKFLKRRDHFIDYFDAIPLDVNLIVYTEDEIQKMMNSNNHFIKNVMATAREL
jgi:predicted nucleotidyltransferase